MVEENLASVQMAKWIFWNHEVIDQNVFEGLDMICCITKWYSSSPLKKRIFKCIKESLYFTYIFVSFDSAFQNKITFMHDNHTIFTCIKITCIFSRGFSLCINDTKLKVVLCMDHHLMLKNQVTPCVYEDIPIIIPIIIINKVHLKPWIIIPIIITNKVQLRLWILIRKRLKWFSFVLVLSKWTCLPLLWWHLLQMKSMLYLLMSALVGWVLWHINLCRLLNAKSIIIQIICSISNNSV